MPETGEKLEFKGLHFEVVDADSKRINRVRLRRIEEAPDSAARQITGE